MCSPPQIYYGIGRHSTLSSLPCTNILHHFQITCQFLKVNIRVSFFVGIIILSWPKCLWILNLSIEVLVLHEVTLWTTDSICYPNSAFTIPVQGSSEKSHRQGTGGLKEIYWSAGSWIMTPRSWQSVGGFPGKIPHLTPRWVCSLQQLPSF